MPVWVDYVFIRDCGGCWVHVSVRFLAGSGLIVINTTNVVNSGVTRATLVVNLASGLYLCSMFSPRNITRRVHRDNFSGIGVATAADITRTFGSTGCVVSSNNTPHGRNVAHRSLLGNGYRVTRRLNGSVGACYPSIGRIIVVFGPTSLANLIALLCSNLGPNRIAALTNLSSAHLRDTLTGGFNIRRGGIANYTACNNRNRRVTIFNSTIGVSNGPLASLVNARTFDTRR